MYEYTQQYPMMYNAMAPSMTYVSGGQELRPVTTTTRKQTRPYVVSREDQLRRVLAGSNRYNEVLQDNNGFWNNLSKTVTDQQVRDALTPPTNKGRLESNMDWGQALSGALLSGLNTYGKFNQAKEDQARKEHENIMKQIAMEDSLLAREEAADLQDALNNQTITVQGMEKVNLPKDGSGSGQQTLQQQLGDELDRESTAVTAADVWNTVNQHPYHFSDFANNDYFGWMTFGDDRKRRGWVSQQAPLIGGVELQKLQRMMPKGFSGAINSPHEQKLMMPVREALTSGIGSKIKPAVETYLGGYYDELQKEYAMKTDGQRLPFTKEDFIADQLTNNAREYNVDYDPADPTKPMFLPIKGVNNTKPTAAEEIAKLYGGTVIRQ